LNDLLITYRFELAQGKTEEFRVRLDPETLDLLLPPRESYPPWTKLTFHKCPNCPLKPEEHPVCPLALAIIEIVEHFHYVLSYDRIVLEVETAERTITQKTSAQQGLSSLLGLLIPASGCPNARYFKPMARFHLPLANREETVYRAVSMYLFAQYFLKLDGRGTDRDLSGLKKIYDDIQIVNESIAERLRVASEADSTVNAIVIVDTFAKTVPFFIEESLDCVKPLFSSYLDH